MALALVLERVVHYKSREINLEAYLCPASSQLELLTEQRDELSERRRPVTPVSTSRSNHL